MDTINEMDKVICFEKLNIPLGETYYKPKKYKKQTNK